MNIYIYIYNIIFKYSSHVFWCFKSQEINLIAFNNLILTSLWAPCAMQLPWHYGYVRQELLWTWFCFVVFFQFRCHKTADLDRTQWLSLLCASDFAASTTCATKLLLGKGQRWDFVDPVQIDPSDSKQC